MAFPLMMLPAAFQFAVGAGQTIKGLTMDPGERPEYEIPDTANEALANAKYIASQTKLPGEDLIQDRMKENMANAIFTTSQAAQDPSQIIAGTQKITEAFNNQQVDMGIKGAEFFYQNQGQLRGELNRMAEREDTKWTLNEYNPFMEETQRKQALIGGGMENLQGSFNSIMQVDQFQKYMDALKQKNDFENVPRTGETKQTVVPATIPNSSKQPIKTSFDAPKVIPYNPTGTPVPQPGDPESILPSKPEPFSPVRNPFGI